MSGSGRSAPRLWRGCLAVGVTGLALLVAGCGGGDSNGSADAGDNEGAAEQQLRIGVVLPDFTQNELILGQKTGAEAAAAELGVELTLQGSSSADEQVKALEDMIALNPDALIYNFIDAAAAEPAVEQARESGLPLVCTVSCAGEAAAIVDFNYRTDMGKPLGEWIAGELPDGGTVGFIDSSRADPGVQGMYDGIQEAFDEAGVEIDMRISPPTNWDRAAADRISRDFLTANPDLDLVVGMHDLIAAATRDNMDELGYKKVPLAGLGGTCEGVRNILTGRQDFTVLQDLYPAGYEAVKIAVGLVKGTVQQGEDVDLPMFPLTKQTIDETLAGGQLGKDNPNLLKSLQKAEAGCN